MSFISLNATPSAAVATNGTIAFTLPSAAQWGEVKFEGGHQLYSRGLQAMFNFNTGDFTLSASGATVTVTYKGTTSIPANTLVELQLETAGENNYLFDGKVALAESGKDYLGNVRWATAKPVRVMIGAPSAASATTVVNAAARTGTNTLTTYSPSVVLDVPRCLQYVSSNAGDTTQTVIVAGLDEYNVPMTEKVTLNGTTVVSGKKAFKTVISDTTSATLTGNLSIGQLATFGLPFFLPGGTGAGLGYFLKEVQDGAVPTAGTAKGGDVTVPATNATGDVRGTWTPNAAADGSKVFEAVIMATDVTFKGITQA